MCLGVPGRVSAVDDSSGLTMGTVDFGGVQRQVCLAYVPDVRVGEYVVVHVGFAISRLDEAEALRTLQLLQAMGDLLERELTPEAGS
ncbi:HypC/HybG/HupF family hydrogenase formation chaperone [Dactylosporangium matsuzakiense]|uniref:Hydrogenase assembly protein HypC n=1 Tax=Dactylosporangium matsuzakiense TaxID=53360 RepID=A0A9W6NQM7_9ACTN|nr:HypC/HybG/HupF family hydrogenase formation chaperone [Dactylosporangium matsuzakiense]UWZ42346.1 HypC/HybG/HupF family hydrogenase formation chaperone [Dactylosporangium matsuzakiense]GLL05277.1 hydrogenase assembly protein HypC [Dactylosporangium matsuzakiense]